MFKIEAGDARATASFDSDLEMISGAGLYKQISRCIRMQYGVEASALNISSRFQMGNVNRQRKKARLFANSEISKLWLFSAWYCSLVL